MELCIPAVVLVCSCSFFFLKHIYQCCKPARVNPSVSQTMSLYTFYNVVLIWWEINFQFQENSKIGQSLYYPISVKFNSRQKSILDYAIHYLVNNKRLRKNPPTKQKPDFSKPISPMHCHNLSYTSPMGFKTVQAAEDEETGPLPFTWLVNCIRDVTKNEIGEKCIWIKKKISPKIHSELNEHASPQKMDVRVCLNKVKVKIGQNILYFHSLACPQHLQIVIN